uniref:Uncharacterized protein n=1 Tax=Arundo donax TaxID=35708 RepID=A0A0A9B012_ARUDO
MHPNPTAPLLPQPPMQNKEDQQNQTHTT